MIKSIFAITSLCLLLSNAHAVTLTINIQDSNGRPVKDFAMVGMVGVAGKTYSGFGVVKAESLAPGNYTASALTISGMYGEQSINVQGDTEVALVVVPAKVCIHYGNSQRCEGLPGIWEPMRRNTEKTFQAK